MVSHARALVTFSRLACLGLFLSGAALSAEPVVVTVGPPAQRWVGTGMNLEDYGRNPGNEPLLPIYDDLIADLRPTIVRAGLVLKAVPLIAERVALLKARGLAVWLSVWNLPDRLVKNPGSRVRRLPADLERAAAEIAGALADIKKRIGREVDFLSFNEPIVSGLVSGGYDLALTPKEQFALLVELDRDLQQLSLSTRLIIGLYKANQASLDYLEDLLAEGSLPASVTGIDIHSYGILSENLREAPAWKKALGETGLTVYCGEWEYDSKFWRNPEKLTWNGSVEKTFLTLDRLVNQIGVSSALVWYRMERASTPARTVAFALSQIPAGRVREVTVSTPEVRAIAFEGDSLSVLLFNTGEEPVQVEFSNVRNPTVERRFRESTVSASFSDQDSEGTELAPQELLWIRGTVERPEPGLP